MPNWYLKLMYKWGRKPSYYGIFHQEEMVRFCATNQINQTLWQTENGIYIKR